MAGLWSAECLLLVWSDLTGMLLNATVKLVWRAVAPISPGWKSLTSDLWAVKSSEIQSSDGGERDKERHRSNSEQHSLWRFSVSVHVSHKRTMTLTYSLVAALNGTYKRVCCSGDSRGSTFPWRLPHGDLLNPQMYTDTHTCTHILCCCWERHYQSQDVCADGEKFRASVTHYCCRCTDEKTCAVCMSQSLEGGP